MQNPTAADLVVLALELAPAIAFGLAGERIAQGAERWPRGLRLVLPVVCALPYALIAASHQMFSWMWLALYATLPTAVACLLEAAALVDHEQRGNWRDALVLAVLGLAVDLRWFEPAWPSGLAGLG